MIPEPIGGRIAGFRQRMDWTQQALADRLGISRVAVSHIEANISLPGERTITLLAGLFKIPPHDLVWGTTYPQAKVDRLPRMVCSYTHFELTMALFENDMTWMERLQGSSIDEATFEQIKEKWSQEFEKWGAELLDEEQLKAVEMARSKLMEINKVG